MKLVCFGLPLAPLLLLEDGHEVLLAVLSPGNHGGGRRLRRRLGSAAVWPEKVDAGLVERKLAEAELLVSWFWPRRLPGGWLARPRHGALGVHPSLLPRHRGPDPYFWAIDSGDTVTGVSAHRLTEQYDAGDVLAKEQLAIGARDSWQLARALDRPSLRVLRAAVRQIETGYARPEPQDERHATWAPSPGEAELRVDWGWPTARVLRRIRALAPVPGLALEFRGVRFRVVRARPAEQYPRALLPGEGTVVSAIPPGEPRPAAPEYGGNNRISPARCHPSGGTGPEATGMNSLTLVLRTGDGAIAVEQAMVTPESGESWETAVGERELAGLASRPVVLDSLDGGP